MRQARRAMAPCEVTRPIYFTASFARVEWSFAWPGRGIELDSSVGVIDFIGSSFAFAVVPGAARSVTDDAGGTGDAGATVAVGASARLP